ncbi:MAG: TonB-dependent receptor [Melioribacteraceae bacterium]|nr:TonB-dependent receptor [Melioribacteraceae bacterium]
MRGTVLDITTEDPLFGANIIIQGTSLGAATNFDGNYVIRNIPVGQYTITVSYIGYGKVTTEVTISENRTLEQNFNLQSITIEGEAVVVTAQALGQKQAINQQLSSNTITNVVSSEKIRELPDADAATALSRLPGLSLMNGDQVVIRGVQAKQNLVLVNGIQLPSTDVNTRATNLGFISANMLAGIEVVKVLTPDMDANAIGGIVNLRLREAPSGFHFDVLSQGSLNYQDRTLGNYRFWASASQRFLDDKLGVFLQGNADRFDGGGDRTSAAYERYEPLPYGEAPYRMNNFTLNDQQNITSTYGGSLLLDYKLPDGKIMLQNTISEGVNDLATHNTQLDLQNNRVIYSLNRDKYDRTLIANALQMEYNFGDIKGELILSHSASDRNTDIRYGDPGDNTNFSNAAGAPFGYDDDGNKISYANLRNNITPSEVLDIEIDEEDYKGADISDWAVIREVAFKQHIYNAQLDFSIPFSFSKDFTSIFKVGGKFKRTTRENDLNRWYKRTGDEDFYANVRNFIPGKILTNQNQLLFTDIQNTDYDRGQYYLNETYDFKYAFDIDRLDDFYTQARSGWGQAVHKDGTLTEDFSGSEMFSGAYLMGTFNIGPRISLILGGRYEHYNMDYTATNFYVTHPVDGNGRELDTLNSVNRDDDTFFPNVQLRYKFTDWSDIRVAYTQTISRPDYQAILPNTYFSPGLTNRAGNPKLKPAISTNLDVYLSFYNNEIGLFTVGGFYKEIQDVFYQTPIFYRNLSYFNVSFPDSAFWRSQVTSSSPNGITPPAPSDRVTTYINNPDPAKIKGLEIDWQTNFWYLPEPLNSLVFNINYTRVWSEMDYQQLRNEVIREQYIDPVTGRIKFRETYLTTDTVRTARLLNQGNDILNIALGVDYKGFSGRISFNMQGNVIYSVGVRPEDDQFTGNIYKWDFTLKQELPWEGLSVSLSGINIFHNATKTYRKFRRVVDGPISDHELSTAYYPRIFELNLRYML